ISTKRSEIADHFLPATTAQTEIIPHFIDGQLVEGTSGRFGQVYTPTHGRAARRVAFASKAEVDRAIDAAAAAFPEWAASPPLRRARILNRFRDLLERDQARLAALITSEHGKVLSDAKGEVQRGLEVVEFATGIPQMLKGEYTEEVGTGVDSYSMR